MPNETIAPAAREPETRAPAAPAVPAQNVQREAVWSPDRITGVRAPRRLRLRPVIYTVIVLLIAAALSRAMWGVYMEGPWTRDGTVRAYIAGVTPEVSGTVIELKVTDNQFVHANDLLMRIDPTNYVNAVRSAEATLQQARANAANIDAEIALQAAQISASEAQVAQVKATLVFARQQATRYQELSQSVAGSIQNAQQYQSQLHQQEAALAGAEAALAAAQKRVESLKAQRAAADAAIAQASAQLDQAKVNLERTQLRSPVNGWVTNLLVSKGDFASAGKRLISVVDADSFWVDGYFEETSLVGIRVGDPARVKLMGHSEVLHGHVASVARAIRVANAEPSVEGVATVDPIFTWVRLAQRIPVRIHLDQVPPDVILSAGMTATVEVDPSGKR